jgi:hypothetical protein
MFLLVVVLSVHASLYNDQKKHGKTIQRPKETWTDNTTTKRNMDRQYNDQKKHGPVHVSFGRCIACPCFFWSLYCQSMFLLVVVLAVHVKHGQTIQRPKETWTDNTTTKRKHGQAIQRPKETWTDNTRPKETWTNNTTTKRSMDRQYNDQQVHVSFGRCIVCPCFFW